MKRAAARVACFALVLLNAGCAAITNPTASAVPVRRVPDELLLPVRDDEQTIPLAMLGQPKPERHRIGPRDILGVYVEGVLGERSQPLPVHMASQVVIRDQRRLPPAAGYPIEVQANGTIELPFAPPLSVLGLTLSEARDAIRDHYIKAERIKPEFDRVIVTLVQPRQHQVLVLRQEAANFTLGPSGLLSTAKRGSGHLIDLPAFENDILHALTLTGGLPGLDACNALVIYRGCFRDRAAANTLLQRVHGERLPDLGPQAVRIPLRLPQGHPLPFRLEDVILQDGDVLFIEARDNQVFYTGGLLPSGAHVLPRDHDLDVLEAVAMVRGPLLNGAFGGSNLSGALISPGVGNPSPSLLVVLRKTPGGGQLPIRVDLHRALANPQERIVLRADDVLLLQEKPEEALARYLSQTFFNFNFLWVPFRTSNATGIVDIAAPDRLNERLGNVNLRP
jgi:protein involved in polysaccharide export with SLBB domain